MESDVAEKATKAATGMRSSLKNLLDTSSVSLTDEATFNAAREQVNRQIELVQFVAGQVKEMPSKIMVKELALAENEKIINAIAICESTQRFAANNLKKFQKDLAEVQKLIKASRGQRKGLKQARWKVNVLKEQINIVTQMTKDLTKLQKQLKAVSLKVSTRFGGGREAPAK